MFLNDCFGCLYHQIFIYSLKSYIYSLLHGILFFSTFFLYKTQPLLVIIQLMYVKKIQHGQDLMIHGNEKTKNFFLIIDYHFSILIFIIPFLLNCTFDVFNFYFFFGFVNINIFFFFVYTCYTNSVQKLLSLNDVVDGHVNQKNCYVLYYTQVVV